ncbi:3-deoxy-D-manno-octulosonic acid transferase [Psychrobacter sp. I-STPA10]|uniref:3-deoxy-D-manno-octulosonic acid transferase n=1 Tax=Psychrobacter sp. I-STPA10 TaxID=2585769 RepID=UPI001E5EAE64|nr:3-deoxy-D-manno-octulosonic acid transferase [Psychrobacter sp. I-STPA10]
MTLSASPLPPPLYYRLLIKLLKPLYYFKIKYIGDKKDKSISGHVLKDELNQRFGKIYPALPQRQQIIWCHAVSLGETNTIAPMIDELLTQGFGVWLTNTTHTGYARSQICFAHAIADGQLVHSYVPVDAPQVIKSFLQHVQPCLAMFVETELWANTLYILAQQQIPSVLVNARLSEKSWQNYQKIAAVSHSMMQNISLIIAQDNESAKRFRQLGAASHKIRRASSLKWSVNSVSSKLTQSDALFTQNITTKRPIWVAASTHAGEEAAVLKVQQQLLNQPQLSHTLLVLVPRHPERFDEVAEMIEAFDFQYARRSQQQSITEQTQVYLADTMGELMRWYQMADVAFVGGSMVDIGGHNPVEPASVATPIIMGKYTQSCDQIVAQLQAVDALQQVGDNEDIAGLYKSLEFWLNDKMLAKQAGQNGYQLVCQHQDAMDKQLAMICPLLPSLNISKPTLATGDKTSDVL